MPARATLRVRSARTPGRSSTSSTTTSRSRVGARCEIASACLAASACGTRMCNSTWSLSARQVAAARLTPASLIAAATRASAPGSFSISMTRSNGIDALSQIVRLMQKEQGRSDLASGARRADTCGVSRAETRYARSGDVSIAYQVVGEGPFDTVFVPGYVSNVELIWKLGSLGVVLARLASISRLIVFDKRGVGMSDRVDGIPDLDTRMDDVRAVMDAAGSARAAIVGASEGSQMRTLVAASYPERTTALVL